MVKRKHISGSMCVKVLCKHFGFKQHRQKGSHLVLRKYAGEVKLVTVVPLHRQLAPGTIKSVLKLANVEETDFYTCV